MLLIGKFQRNTCGVTYRCRRRLVPRAVCPIERVARARRRGIMEAVGFRWQCPAWQASTNPLWWRRRAKAIRAAFGELVRRYEGKIFRLAQHVTQNREDAEDVLQETFMKAYEHLDQFQGNSKFYTWIVRIAVNQALMKLRRRKTDKSVSLDEPIDTGEDTVVREIAAWDEDPEQRVLPRRTGRILDTAIQSLEPPIARVFVLRDIEELSTEETAEALGPFRAGGEEQIVAGPPAIAREADPLFQAQGRRRLCLHVKTFCSELSDYLDENIDAELRTKLERHITECPNCWVIADTTRKTIQIYKGMEPYPIPHRCREPSDEGARKEDGGEG